MLAALNASGSPGSRGHRCSWWPVLIQSAAPSSPERSCPDGRHGRTMNSVEHRPFEGVRVVELAQWVFVPVAGALLAEWGADVIRVERPEGDPYRALATQGIGTDSGGVNLSVALANRGKRSIALDVRSEGGREVLHRLLRSEERRVGKEGRSWWTGGQQTDKR